MGNHANQLIVQNKAKKISVIFILGPAGAASPVLLNCQQRGGFGGVFVWG